MTGRQITDLLQRRSDLSTFLVHLTRSTADLSARDVLLRIVCEHTLRAGRPMGMASADHLPQEVLATQRTVCFTETPLEHVWMLVEEIADRQVNLEPYGIAFTKSWARRRGVNPIWYLDITRGHDWLTTPVNTLVTEAVDGRAGRWDPDAGAWVPYALVEHPVLRLAPFFEQMGSPAERRKEFWWEREWRHVGDLTFNRPDVVALFVPFADHEAFHRDWSEIFGNLGYATDWPFALLDPTWGLERMIASLARVQPADVGPFP